MDLVLTHGLNVDIVDVMDTVFSDHKSVIFNAVFPLKHIAIKAAQHNSRRFSPSS